MVGVEVKPDLLAAGGLRVEDEEPSQQRVCAVSRLFRLPEICADEIIRGMITCSPNLEPQEIFPAAMATEVLT